MLTEVGFVCVKDKIVFVTCVYCGTYCKIFEIRFFFWGTWMGTKKAQKEKKTTQVATTTFLNLEASHKEEL